VFPVCVKGVVGVVSVFCLVFSVGFVFGNMFLALSREGGGGVVR